MARPTTTPTALAVRCAIYTRKSSEEGLDQDFNSLHAQRDACEAYVQSQVGEGWRLLPTLYDDGGYSGGNIERPALQRLLADIDRGAIDTVVVYKIDRLTRSLMDFAKIVDRFDAKGASFVSVTQSFNTTTSMGRLTLNVLLSFAQFEREVTSERIRDKLAASKRKGLWMGGTTPLGYDASGRTLVANETEAGLVRHIFDRYLELKSVHELCRELEAHGHRPKKRVNRFGASSGGESFRRGALFHLLSNRVYLGLIVHKENAYPGQHCAIVDPDIFDNTQRMLASNRGTKRQSRDRRALAWPLTGKLFTARGEPMTPTKAYGRGGRHYRYYVATSLQKGERLNPGTLDRIAASQAEEFLAEQLSRLLQDGAAAAEKPLAMLIRARVDEESMTLIVRSDGPSGALRHAIRGRLQKGEEVSTNPEGNIEIFLPMRLKMRGGRSWRHAPDAAVMRAKPNRDHKLISGLQRAHGLLSRASCSPLQGARDILQARSLVGSYERRLIELAFLAPDIQQAIMEGRQPRGLTLQGLLAMDIPKAWTAQRTALIFPR